MTRRTFSPEYKQEAVNLVRVRGLPVSQVARHLSLHENVLRAWMRDRCESGTSASYAKMRVTTKDVDNLRAELKRTALERDLLLRALECLAGGRQSMEKLRFLFDMNDDTCHMGLAKFQ